MTIECRKYKYTKVKGRVYSFVLVQTSCGRRVIISDLKINFEYKHTDLKSPEV